MINRQMKEERSLNDGVLLESQKQQSNLARMNHSLMAMEAAKKMRRSRHKRKTGRVVCHHLRMMLATECADDISSAVTIPVTTPVTTPVTRQGKEFPPGRAIPFFNQKLSNQKTMTEDKQISLL